MSEPLTPDELAAESGTPLPQKEVMSLLDLNANIDLGLNLAATVDLAAAANLNIAAPIDAAASANVLSLGSEATAAAPQQTLIDQHISGSADANAPQTSTVDQASGTAPTPTGGGSGTSLGDLTDGTNLLNVDVNLDANANIAAPIDGAVAANANVAAPIDAAVAANVGSIDSSATAYAPQTAIIQQDLDNVSADATASQDANVTQQP